MSTTSLMEKYPINGILKTSSNIYLHFHISITTLSKMVRRHPVTSFKVSCVIWSSFFPHNNSTSSILGSFFFETDSSSHTPPYRKNTSRLSAGKHLPIIMAKASLPNWLSISEPTPSERRRQFHMDWPWWAGSPENGNQLEVGRCRPSFLGTYYSRSFFAQPCEEEWICWYFWCKI